MSDAGYVYILINPSYDGMVKIGKTKRDPESRARELSSATGVPTPFYVAYIGYFNDCSSAEVQLHDRLAEYRLTENREFFRVPLSDAIRIFAAMQEELGGATLEHSSDAIDDLSNDSGLLSQMHERQCDKIIEDAEKHLSGIENQPKDVSKGIESLKDPASRGCVKAYGKLGDIYISDEIVPRDGEAARGYYLKGIEQGHDALWMNLGRSYYLYVDGIDEKAENWIGCYIHYFKCGDFRRKPEKDMVSDVMDYLHAIGFISRCGFIDESELDEKIKLLITIIKDDQKLTYKLIEWLEFTVEKFGGDFDYTDPVEERCLQMLRRLCE